MLSHFHRIPELDGQTELVSCISMLTRDKNCRIINLKKFNDTQSHIQTFRQTSRETDTHLDTDRHTSRQTDSQTVTHPDSQSHIQTDRHTSRQSDI